MQAQSDLLQIRMQPQNDNIQSVPSQLDEDTGACVYTQNTRPVVMDSICPALPIPQRTLPWGSGASSLARPIQPLSAQSLGDRTDQSEREQSLEFAPAILQMYSAANFGEQGWYIQQQPPRTASVPHFPFLDQRSIFQTRPLLPGTLAQIHNDWLLAHGQGDGQRPDLLMSRGLPSPDQTFDSRRLRAFWQEIERRRIVDLSQGDAGVIMLAQNRAYHQLRISLYACGTPREPTHQEISKGAKELWEKSKLSLLYCSALLRQAEFALAQGSLALRPSDYIQSLQRQTFPPQGQAPQGQANPASGIRTQTGGQNIETNNTQEG